MSWVGFIISMIFMVLRLTDNIDWSWWLVWLPVSIAVVLDLALASIVFYIANKQYKQTSGLLSKYLEELGADTGEKQ